MPQQQNNRRKEQKKMKNLSNPRLLAFVFSASRRQSLHYTSSFHFYFVLTKIYFINIVCGASHTYIHFPFKNHALLNVDEKASKQASKPASGWKERWRGSETIKGYRTINKQVIKYMS
jgi:hypothetical protein